MSDNDDDDDNIPASHSFIAHFIEFHSLFCTVRSPKKKKFSKTNSLHNDRLSTITIEFLFWDNNTNHEHMNEWHRTPLLFYELFLHITFSIIFWWVKKSINFQLLLLLYNIQLLLNRKKITYTHSTFGI
mgnify:CR=1 FL=1